MSKEEELELVKQVAASEGMHVRYDLSNKIAIGIPGEPYSCYWGLDCHHPWFGDSCTWGLMQRAQDSLRPGNKIFVEKFSKYVGLSKDAIELILTVKGF